jgi:hypothetical protein
VVSVFISYRRDDTRADAGRLYDALCRAQPAARLFMDVDSLLPGQNWVRVIDRAVADCDVFLALIGERWLAVTDGAGVRRIDSETDHVRLEIAAALAADKWVIPVLLENASMPTALDLPPPLRGLVERESLRVRHETFSSDIQRLVAALAAVGRLGPPADSAIPLAIRGSRRERLITALLSAVPDAQRLPQLAHRAGLDQVALSPDPRTSVDSLLTAAVGRNRLAALVDAARDLNPGAQLLDAWVLDDAFVLDCPYRGLLPFREEDSDIFFGRDEVSAHLVAAVASRPLTALVGPSGSGKSSIVFAGVLPRLRKSGRWIVAPFRPGHEPLRQLSFALVAPLDPEASEVGRLDEGGRLASALRTATSAWTRWSAASSKREDRTAGCS